MVNDIMIRTKVRSGDIGKIVLMHADHYWKEHGFDHEFEAYVASPLAELVLRKREDERLWVVEKDGRVEGSLALTRVDQNTSQLRWFYLEPELRGHGMGRQLMNELIAFARSKGYSKVILWTVDNLWDAIRVYERNGFKKVETRAHRMWGLDIVEERYELEL